ncbi:protein kinase domain-containing protein [Streptomyces finlayi]|uniref:protein kinase domain-containing protein n=1 Tax=Streptomyces finlayi TaxID=67296 RepID=UPI001CA48543|nr:hypothetical protein [Streptomyces finlayi]
MKRIGVSQSTAHLRFGDGWRLEPRALDAGSGRPPADRRSTLVDRLAAEGGLHPYAVADSISAALDAVVFQSTAADLQERLASPDDFLRLLDAAEADTAAAEQPGGAVADPLAVLPGQPLDSTWTVARVLGTGAAARALLVRRTADEGAAEPDSPRVFKVALDREKDARLYAEAEALKEVGGGRIAKLLAEPRELAGRTVLEIEYAGGFRSPADRDPVSLGSRLRGQGSLGYDQLERFGNDLFDALDSLAARGVRHRDIKPDNLGLFKRNDGSWQLMLFDFSLAEAPDQDIHAGTRGYLDPFLGGSRRARYDDHAEWYAAAVTLHEMASGERPVWGDGQSDPLTVVDAELYVARELVDPALSEGLTRFFERALHRDVEQRYDSLRQMAEGWRQLFRTADSARPATTPATVGMNAEDIDDVREQVAAAAGLTTPLEAAGLSPRAVSVAAGLGAATVKALLDIPPHTISRARGAGNVIRKELNRRHRQWTHDLRKRSAAKAPVPVASDASEEALESVDTLAARLTPAEGNRRTKPRPDVVRTTLQLPGAEPLDPWPAQPAIAKALGISQPTVSQHQLAAIEQWAALPWLRRIRDELVTILSEQGRVSARLDTSRRRGGFLALTLKGAELPGIAARLASRFAVVPVSLDELFLTALRELAEEQGVRWQALLKADATFAASGVLGPALASYTRLASERVAVRVTAVAEQAGPRTILLAHQAGLPARYWEAEAGNSWSRCKRRPAAPRTLRMVCGSWFPPRTRRRHRLWTAARWMSWTG